MCGILGCVQLPGFRKTHELTEFKKGLEIISYRGPDNSSFKEFKTNYASGEGAVFLGHNRLSIIDLSDAGNQPFSIEDDYHIIFNGEIYNYIELRDDLVKKGHYFRTGSDTEVLLKLYIDSGTSRFGELNGMWSLIIYDRKKNVIVASRDRFGVKPMYLYEQDGTLIFASEIKQLLIFSGRRSVNKKVMSNYLHYYLLDNSNETFFDGITKLPAMQNLIVDLQTGAKHFEKYWSFNHIDFNGSSDTEIVDCYKELLTSAVSIRLRSDVKVGNTLSGGLDSSSIAALSHQLTKGNIYNYSVISNNKQVSEEKFVDYLIASNGINVEKINFDDVNPWKSLDEVIWHHDEPILSLSTIAHYKMLEKLKAESGIIVVLSGQGGDESLAGYNKYFFFNIKDLVRKGQYADAAKEIYHLGPRMFSEFNWNFAKRYIPFLNRMKINGQALERILTMEKYPSNLGAASNLEERQRLDIEKYSVPPLCHYEDRNSMAHSLEIRLPFLDFRLINYSLNLPNKFKIKNAVNKQILRKAMTELPDQIRYRFDKKGFTIDEKGHQSATFFKMVEDSFKDSALADLKLIDIDQLRMETKKMKAKESALWERDLHRILFAETWAKRFL